MSKSNVGNSFSVLGVKWVGLTFMLLYVLGYLFPDYWWSTHFLGFLNPVAQFIIIGASIIVLIFGFKPTSFGAIIENGINAIPILTWRWMFLALALIMGILFFIFPMIQDFYGEAYKLNPHIGALVPEIPKGTDEALFHFGIAPWDGQRTILSLVTYLAYFIGWNYHDTFLLFDAFFGLLFMATWFYFIQKHISNGTWKLLLTITGVTAPILLNFFGHIEINAPVYWANLTWIVLAINYSKTPTLKGLIGLLAFLLIAIKLHPVALLFTPALLLLIVTNYVPQFSFSWKRIGAFILTPIFVMGAMAYFFIFKDHVDERELATTAMEYDRLFLPLFSPPAPLDKYNMLSFNHIFDYFSEMLLWSPIAVFLVAVILIFYRKKISWEAIEVKISAITLILFGALFFVTNPLLTMQMDWDLFAFPAPILLVFLVMLVKQLEGSDLLKQAWSFVLALGIISIATFMVHFNAETLSYRLESVSKRIYHTYYEWSALTIRNSLGLLWEDRELQLNRKDEFLSELYPFAVEGNDREYGAMWYQEGKHFFNVEKNYVKSLQYFEMAEKYAPEDDKINQYLMKTYFVMGNPKEAYLRSLKLVTSEYPSLQLAIMSAIECALEAEDYANAKKHCQFFVANWDEPRFIHEIHSDLQDDINKGRLKSLFKEAREN